MNSQAFPFVQEDPNLQTSFYFIVLTSWTKVQASPFVQEVPNLQICVIVVGLKIGF